MKVLVTGGAGFIASHVVNLYVESGFQVVVVDNLSMGRFAHVDPAATFYPLDLRSPELAQVFARERPDVVNHHAGLSDVRRSMDAPVENAEANIVGSLKLLECCRDYGVRTFIYASSGGAVYGEPRYLPCDEAHPLEPISPYGVGKVTVERHIQIFQANYGFETVVFRYPNVYGPRQDRHARSGVVAIFAGRMLAGQPPLIHGDGEQMRDFVYVTDCARANLLALTGRQVRGTFNLGSGQGTTVNEVVAALQRITGDTHRPSHSAERPGEIRRIYLSAEKAERELGWRTEVAMPEGLRRTVEHLRTAVMEA